LVTTDQVEFLSWDIAHRVLPYGGQMVGGMAPAGGCIAAMSLVKLYAIGSIPESLHAVTLGLETTLLNGLLNWLMGRCAVPNA
jgi:hypothetical protein